MKLFGGKHAGSHVASGHPPSPSAEKQGNLSPAVDTAPRDWRSFLREHRKALIALCVVLVVALGAVLAVLGVRRHLVPPDQKTELPSPVQQTPAPPVETGRPIATPPPTEPGESPEPGETEEPEPTEEPVVRREGVYTFVLLALDQLQANTDVILVCRFDTVAGTLDVVNIPRDTLVNVSWEVKKLNTVLAFERSDPQAFLDHLEGIVGFEPDNYAIVNIAAVEALVNVMGGVNYYVPRTMEYDDPTQDLHIHIPEGYQHLNGEDAVKVLRFRQGNEGTGYATGDIGRIQTQQGLLMAVAKQFLTLKNIPNLNRAIEIVETYVKTDLTRDNMLFYADEFLKLDSENVRFHTAPGIGVAIRGGSYYQLELEEWIDLLNEYLNPWSAPISEKELDVLRQFGMDGAVSTTGEVVPFESFFNFFEYTG